MYIYVLICKVNWRVYVGKAKDVWERWSSHKLSAKQGDPWLICNAIRKYGAENFLVRIIEFGIETDEELNRLEKFHIAQRKSYPPELGFGYNMTEGGDGLCNPCEETRKKMSAATKKAMTPERREFLRQLGFDTPPERRAAIRESVMEHVSEPGFSERHSKVIKDAFEKNPIPREVFERQAASRRGSKRTEETKKHMSEVQSELADHYREKALAYYATPEGLRQIEIARERSRKNALAMWERRRAAKNGISNSAVA